MNLRTLLATNFAVAALLAAQPVFAQPKTVTIYLKSGKSGPLKDKVIASESVQGIKLQGQADVLPPDTIDEVDYSNFIDTVTVRVKLADALVSEKEVAKAAKDKRVAQLEATIAKYQQTLDEMPKELLQPRRHVEFKLGMLNAQLGLGGDKEAQRIKAIKLLSDFKKANPNTWQFTPTMMMLIRLHAEQQEFADMRADVKELAAAQVPANVKSEAKMLVIRYFMESGKTLLRQKKAGEAEKQFAKAKTDLDSLLTELPKDSPLRMPAELALAQCKAVDKDKKAEATKELKQLLQKATEKETRAVIYNTLGEIYYDDGQLQDARWQFLWVDVIYNQDKEEHAKALYYLWKIFNQLSEPERGVEFFEILASPRMAGTFYQQKALKENKEAQ